MTKRVLAKGLCAALVGGALMVAGPAQAEGCAEHEARQALELRVLQSEMMVAALTCGQRQSYNAFVTTFKPYLKAQGANLRAFFTEQFGLITGPKHLNRMVTRLANTASQQSLVVPKQTFCERAKMRFKTVLNADAQALLHLARVNPRADSHGYKSCVEVAKTEVQSTPDQN